MGSYVTLHYDFEDTLFSLGGWVEGWRRGLEAAGLDVGEVSTSQSGLALTEREGVWSGTIRLGVKVRSEAITEDAGEPDA